jgi:hypothetical protein
MESRPCQINLMTIRSWFLLEILFFFIALFPTSSLKNTSTTQNNNVSFHFYQTKYVNWKQHTICKFLSNLHTYCIKHDLSQINVINFRKKNPHKSVFSYLIFFFRKWNYNNWLFFFVVFLVVFPFALSS